jgi:hypothetical protein
MLHATWSLPSLPVEAHIITFVCPVVCRKTRHHVSGGERIAHMGTTSAPSFSCNLTGRPRTCLPLLSATRIDQTPGLNVGLGNMGLSLASSFNCASDCHGASGATTWTATLPSAADQVPRGLPHLRNLLEVMHLIDPRTRF